jgi:hypothetical protein
MMPILLGIQGIKPSFHGQPVIRGWDESHLLGVSSTELQSFKMPRECELRKSGNFNKLARPLISCFLGS